MGHLKRGVYSKYRRGAHSNECSGALVLVDKESFSEVNLDEVFCDKLNGRLGLSVKGVKVPATRSDLHRQTRTW